MLQLEMEAHIALTNVDLFATQSFVLKHDPNCFCVFSKTLNQRYFLVRIPSRLTITYRSRLADCYLDRFDTRR